MAAPLFQTKLYMPPARPGLVSRPRLIERLNAGLNCRLTLVSAPAGFGKTTLLSEWIHSRGGVLPPVDGGLSRPTVVGGGKPLRRPAQVQETEAVRTQGRLPPLRVAWVSVDEGDNDVVRFWSYVVAALQTLEPAIGQAALGALQAARAQPPPLEPILASLANDVTALLPGERPTLLVLDDYHVIDTQGVHESLDYLIGHLPPALRLAIASRQDPPLTLSLLRGRGQLNEIRAADLRFTPAETAEFLSAAMGLRLSPDDIAALETRTEGWAVGLKLAALSLRGRTEHEAHAFVSTFAGDDRYVADYLLEQVLRRQPPDIQRFLIQTSILDRLCGSLCDVVLASQSTSPDAPPAGAPPAGAAQVLESLERAGLFVLALDNRRHWYRYHPLFADLLQSRLASAQPERVSELHLRASAWYEQQASAGEAISHALAAPDYERAASLVEQYGTEISRRGETALVERWLAALPEDVIRSRPLLCVARGWVALRESTRQAERWAQYAEDLLVAQAEDVDQPDAPVHLDHNVRADLASLRVAMAHRRGDSPGELLELVSQALEVVPESDPAHRAGLVPRLGRCYLDLGDQEAADRAFRQAGQLAEAGQHHELALRAAHGRAHIARSAGRLHDTAAVCRQALRSVVEPSERAGKRVPAAGPIYVALGRVLLEWSDLEEAERALVQGTALSELAVAPYDQGSGYCDLARLRCIRGQYQQAHALLDKAEQILGEWDQDLAEVRALRVRFWLAQAESDPPCLDRAIRWARGRTRGHAGEVGLEPQTLAWVRIAQRRARGQPDLSSTLRLLEERFDVAQAAGATESMIQILVLQALALQAEGELYQALTPLKRALALAETEGYVRAFVDQGAPMAELLRKAVAQGMVPGHAGELLRVLEREAQGAVPLVVAEPAPHAGPRLSPLPESLTERELEVLRLLPTRLSGPEIADHLTISPSTFRSHTKSIYGKLGVHRRADAVERARELKLI